MPRLPRNRKLLQTISGHPEAWLCLWGEVQAKQPVATALHLRQGDTSAARLSL